MGHDELGRGLDGVGIPWPWSGMGPFEALGLVRMRKERRWACGGGERRRRVVVVMSGWWWWVVVGVIDDNEHSLERAR